MKHYILTFSMALVGCSSQANFTDGSTSRRLPPPAEPPAPKADDANPNEAQNPQAPNPDAPQAIDMQFIDGSETLMSLSIHPDTNQVTRSFALRVAPARERDFTQASRDVRSEDFTQGRAGLAGADHLTLRQADVLLVVDNSGSMSPYQDHLADGLTPLLSRFDNTDWQIAIVTTDSSCLRDRITRADWARDPADAERRFASAVRAGTTGSSDERGIEMGFKGLDGVCRSQSRPWRRVGAATVALIVSNEENCGSASNEGCPSVRDDGNGSGPQPTGLTHYLPQDFIDREPATPVYALLYTEADCGADGYNKDPLEYEELARRTGGRWDLVCQSDYSSMMTTMSDDVSKMVVRTFHLQHAPDSGSVQLFVNGLPYSTTFNVVGDKIDLTGTLPNGDAVIDVQYTWSETRWSDVVLSMAATAATLVVTVNDAPLDASHYSYAANSQSVHFSPAPAAGAAVKVAYRSGDLPRNFSLGELPMAGMVQAYVNDIEVAPQDFTLTGENVQLAAAPADGANVRVMYNVAADVVTHYPAGVEDPSSIDAVHVVDSATGAPISAELVGDDLVVAAGDVAVGRSVNATITSRLSSLHLPQVPVPGSVRAASVPGGKACQITVDQATRRVDFQCPDESHPAEVAVNFLTDADFTSTFTVAGAADYSAWRVWIDDEETTAFAHDGETLTISDAHLAIGSHLKVHAEP